VVEKVLEILGARAEHEVHNHHNFAWHEEHGGRTYWVVRKGCTPARPGQEGFVGGSMGDESVILEGVESPENEEALFSTVHGAGRVMSRSQAAGRVKRRKRFVCRNRDCDRITDGEPCPVHPEAGVMKTSVTEQVRPGLVDWPAVQARLREQGIVLVGGGADEAPEVYKRLPDVLAAHGGTIRVKRRLRPLGVAMAGRDVHDPYKDWGPRERPSAVLGSCRRLIASTAVGAIELDSRRRARPKRRWLECRTSRGPAAGTSTADPRFRAGSWSASGSESCWATSSRGCSSASGPASS